jgi:hypothetical protein
VLSFDAIKHLVPCAIEQRPPKLDLTLYPYLPSASVGMTDAANYLSLLSHPTTVIQQNAGMA